MTYAAVHITNNAVPEDEEPAYQGSAVEVGMQEQLWSYKQWRGAGVFSVSEAESLGFDSLMDPSNVPR